MAMATVTEKAAQAFISKCVAMATDIMFLPIGRPAVMIGGLTMDANVA